MNRLQSEMHRLYHPQASDADGRVRAMMLELARPADWQALGALWRGVQADLDLPAPAIAVNGVDAYQLWFSLAEAVPAAQALAFLKGLCQRYLAGIAAQRLMLSPTTDAPTPRQTPGGLWSALLAPDLAPVFADEPWLDTEPSAEGQADLLCRIQAIKPANFRAALAQLESTAVADPQAADTGQDPRRFLLGVMNDTSVPLQLRIEAAKALL